MPRIFVSYSRQDQVFVHRLVTDLEHFGADVWFDLEDIPAGANWGTEIQKGLDSSTILMLIISSYSMSSTNVEDEWQYFFDQKKTIVPILYEKARVSFQINRLQYIDFATQDYMTALRQLHAQLIKEGMSLQPIPNDYISSPERPVPSRVPGTEATGVQSVSPETQAAQASPAAQAVPRPPNRGALIGAGLIVVLLAILGLVVILPRLSPVEPTPTIAQAAVVTNMVNTVNTATTTATPIPTTVPTTVPTTASTLAPTLTPIPTTVPTTVPTAVPTAAPTLAPGTARFDAKGVAQVWVPAGCFKMGSEENDPLADADEKPAHQVCITRGYWIDAYETTNADYHKFVDDGGYTKRDYWTDDGWNWVKKYRVSAPRDYTTATGARQPRVGISFYEAEAYAHWRGARLPTEAEWEYAARGPQALIYPWGNQWEANVANVNLPAGNPDQSQAVSVGSFPKGKSWIGAYDMCGNVSEYVSDWYDGKYYRMMAKDDPQGPPPSTGKVVRGGTFNSTYKGCRTASRVVYPDFILGAMRIGMRIVTPR